MADIKLRIEVNPDAETETLGTITNKVNNVGTNSNLSNVSFKANSNGVYIDTSNPKESGREMLSWANKGVLRFNSIGYLSTNGLASGKLASERAPDMFVWGAVPPSKKYSVKLTFSNATSLKDIVVYGDKTANQFPTKAIIDGTKTIYSDDYQWAINMETESGTHTIEFVEWNRANYNACLTKIMVMLRYFDLDKGWIESVESLSQQTSAPDTIQYGALANSGRAEILDGEGELQEMLSSNIISASGMPMELLANGKSVQQHLSSGSDYSPENNKLAVELTNRLDKLKDIMVTEETFDQLVGEKTLYSVIESAAYYARNILDLTGTKYYKDIAAQITSKQIRVTEFGAIGPQQMLISDYLKRIKIPAKYLYWERTNCYEFLNDICEAAQLNLIQADDGLIYFIPARPIKLDNDKPIKIMPHSMISPLSYDIVKTNKFDKIYYDRNSLDSVVQDLGGNTPIKDGQISALDGGQILQNSSGEKFLCYFYTVSSAHVLNFDTSFSRDKVYAITEQLGFKRGELHDVVEKDIVAFYAVGKDKSSFNFQEYIDSGDTGIYLLGLTRTLRKATFAAISRITEGYSASQLEFVKFTARPRAIMSKFNEHNLGDGKHGYEFSYKNSFINDKVKIYNATGTGAEYLDEYICNSILHDYSDGISCATTEIFCSNLYYSDGKIAKNWANGEILEVGDLICFEGDKYADGAQRYWRVTERTFVYDGAPKIRIVLQEAK